jgi:hypothetical protein
VIATTRMGGDLVVGLRLNVYVAFDGNVNYDAPPAHEKLNLMHHLKGILP